MLHWVGDEKLDEEQESYRLSTKQFSIFLSSLKDKNLIRLENWEIERDFYAISIDDVPESFYHNAFPLLKEAGVPFTLFVNTSLLDTYGYISTEQLKEMSENEWCTVGSHGVSHGFYHKLNKVQAMDELRQSKITIESIVGKPVELFAFPYGSFSACGFKNKYLVTEVYKYGFGTVACPITEPLTLPKYFLPRINVNKMYFESFLEK